MSRLFLVLPALVAACSASPDSQHAQLLDEVERQVRLPDQAEPLKAYSRYYASAANGEIVGIYLLPDLQRGKCVGDGEDQTSSIGECQPVRGTRNLKANERLWVDNHTLLPTLSGRGCTVVNVAYNPATGQPTRVSCSFVK